MGKAACPPPTGRSRLAATLLLLASAATTLPVGAQVPGLRIKPPTPSALSPVDPMPGTNRDARITFRWRAGTADPHALTLAVTSFQICVYESTRCDASGPGEQVHYRGIDPEVTEFTPWNGVPWTKFQGAPVQWAVAACGLSSAGSQAVTCSWSDSLTFEWLLPAPALAGVTALEPNDTTARFEFRWHPVQRAEYYLLCVTSGPASRCGNAATGPGAFDPLVKRRRPTGYTLDFDVPMFRDRDVIWTVAACSDRLSVGQRCTYQSVPLALAYPNILAPPKVSEIKAIRDDRPVQIKWSLRERQNIRSIRLCVLVGRDGKHAHLTSCDLDNVMLNANRPDLPTSCTLEMPFPGYPGAGTSVAYLSVGACNGRARCWWSERLFMYFEGFGHFMPFAICR